MTRKEVLIKEIVESINQEDSIPVIIEKWNRLSEGLPDEYTVAVHKQCATKVLEALTSEEGRHYVDARSKFRTILEQAQYHEKEMKRKEVLGDQNIDIY